jgi:nuclear transport factor 2 (NTF2) superfamily protein
MAGELDCRLIKELWAYEGNRTASAFETAMRHRYRFFVGVREQRRTWKFCMGE